MLTYRSAPAHFRNGDVELAGTIHLPRASGPHPGAVIIHGSGPETRRGYAFYGRYLARRGIAAWRTTNAERGSPPVSYLPGLASWIRDVTR